MTLLGQDIPLAARALHALGAWLYPPPGSGPAERCRVIAHRGALHDGPQNTVQACRRGIALGAQGVEVDICITADDRAVLWHDRTPDGALAVLRHDFESSAYVPHAPPLGSPARRPVSELDWPTFRHAYGHTPRGGDGVVVPVDLLEDLARYAEDEPRVEAVLLDVKLIAREAGRASALAGELARLAERYRSFATRQVRLLCPQKEVYRALQACLAARPVRADLRLVPDVELPGAVSVARQLGARDVSIGITPRRLWPAIRADIVKAVAERRRGRFESVTVWTVDDRDRLEQVIRLGVDTVLTNEVARARAIADSLQHLGT